MSKSMSDKLNKIIIDENAVIRCIDPEMVIALKSHATFTTTELLEQVQKACNRKISKQKLESIYNDARHSGGFSLDRLYNNLSEITTYETNAIADMLIEGKICSLLQPDGKGWQKGKIKLSFEFIPEETGTLETSSNLPTAESSPLDEIRNSLAAQSN